MTRQPQYVFRSWQTVHRRHVLWTSAGPPRAKSVMWSMTRPWSLSQPDRPHTGCVASSQRRSFAGIVRVRDETWVIASVSS
ncbi:MAG TPA: hypothetical protein VFW06_03435 [Acidimicrobiia bacterium]|nr:hypothetical protein [Acidimicrobiia bacterium]